MKNELIDRQAVLAVARAYLAAPEYSHETDARVRGLLTLAERLPGNDGHVTSEAEAELRVFGDYHRCVGLRALGLTPAQDTPTSPWGPQGFGPVTPALKHASAFCDPELVTVVITDGGQPLNYPQVDYTGLTAVQIPENADDPEEYDPITSALMVKPPSFRTSTVKVSRELLEDQDISLTTFLADAYAIGLVRGAEPSLVATVKSGAKIGAIATGSAESTGGDETGATSIGYSDLSNLIHSVDPAYRRSPKCGFVMNDNTLLSLDSIICKNGEPLFKPSYDAEGYRLLRGWRVGISPSMDDIATSPAAPSYPVAFGSFSHYITRMVKQGSRIQTLVERYAEFGVVGFRAWLQVAGALTGVTVTQSPVKLLQCGS